MHCPSRRLASHLQGCSPLSHHLSFLSVASMAKKRVGLLCSTLKIGMRLEELEGKGQTNRKMNNNTISSWFCVYFQCQGTRRHCWSSEVIDPGHVLFESPDSQGDYLYSTCVSTVGISFASPTLRHLQPVSLSHHAYRLQYRKFQIYIRKGLFHCEDDQTVEQMPREVMEFSSVEIFKIQPVLEPLDLFDPDLSSELSYMSSMCPFQPELCCVSMTL